MVLSFGSTPSLTSTQTFQLDCTLTGTPTSLAVGTITVQADSDPVGAAFDGASPVSQVTAGNGYPVFASSPVPATALVVGNIVPASTTLLIPYSVKGFGNYDTGIGIANTTADPFGGSVAGGATASAGTITFTIFNGIGSTVGTGTTYTTKAGSPGTGLNSSGAVPGGGVYGVLVSDLLTAAGVTGDFQGYIWVQAGFLEAHGTAYIFQGAHLSSAVPLGVLPTVSAASPRIGNSFTEALGF
jgi:hypothetical protein